MYSLRAFVCVALLSCRFAPVEGAVLEPRRSIALIVTGTTTAPFSLNTAQISPVLPVSSSTTLIQISSAVSPSTPIFVLPTSSTSVYISLVSDSSTPVETPSAAASSTQTTVLPTSTTSASLEVLSRSEGRESASVSTVAVRTTTTTESPAGFSLVLEQPVPGTSTLAASITSTSSLTLSANTSSSQSPVSAPALLAPPVLARPVLAPPNLVEPNFSILTTNLTIQQTSTPSVPLTTSSPISTSSSTIVQTSPTPTAPGRLLIGIGMVPPPASTSSSTTLSLITSASIISSTIVATSSTSTAKGGVLIGIGLVPPPVGTTTSSGSSSLITSILTSSSLESPSLSWVNSSSSALSQATNALDVTPTTTPKAVIAFVPLPTLSTSSKSSSATSSTYSLSSNLTATVTTSSVYVSQNTSSSLSWNNSTFTTSSASSTASCVSLTPGGIWTTYIILPNTTTVTETTTLGVPTTFPSTVPNFTPPIQCPSTSGTSTQAPGIVSMSSVGNWSTVVVSNNPSRSIIFLSSTTSKSTTTKTVPTTAPITTRTAIITSKNGVTVTTTVTPPSYSDGTVILKVTVQPTTSTAVESPVLPVSTTPKTTVIIPATTAAPAIDYISTANYAAGLVSHNTAGDSGNAVKTAAAITSIANNGVTVIVSPTEAVIGGESVSIGSSTTVLTQNGAEYTIDASQVVGPAVSINVPITPSAALGVAVANPTTAPPVLTASNLIILDGEPFSAIGSSVVVLGGSTITYGAGIATQTEVVNGETITIGPSGVSFDGSTYGGTANPTGTQIGLVGGFSITEIGSSLAVVDGITLTINPSATPTTATISGHIITAGPGGLDLGGTTLQYPFNPTSTLTADGLSITELGSSLAIIDGYTLTVGPGATPTTAVILGHTITAGSSGLALDGTTLGYPFNPTTTAITAGGITFEEIGATIAVIGGTTYNIGPSATPTTEVFNGETISIGPSGIGFSSTTFVHRTSTGTSTAASAAHTTKKSGGDRAVAGFGKGSVVVCIIFWVGYAL